MRGKLNALCTDGFKLDNSSYNMLLKVVNQFKRCKGNGHRERERERKHCNLVNICPLFHEAIYYADNEYRNEVLNIRKVSRHLNIAPVNELEYNL